MLKPTIFREYDIRGIAETELQDAGIQDLGRAVGTYLQRHNGKNINLGRDCRLSSERLRNALMAGLKSSGCHVTDIGVVPTPVLYYSVFHLKADGAVMITGSHNPSEYNGFKVVSGASTIHGEQIQEVRRLIENRDFLSGEGTEKLADAVTPYVDEIAAQFHFDRRVKVVFDAGNGTAGPVMQRLIAKLNCEATTLFFDMDGRFPNHHPDPTVPANLALLIDAVKREGAELGIAFDGDSDRIGAVDENGEVVFGDQLMIVYSREILSRKPGATFIGEVKCSQTLYNDIRERGGNGIMWKTGHSLIKAKMKEERAELAGEMSGHMFFADRYYVPKMVSTPEIRVDCPDEAKFDVVARVSEHFRKLYPILDVDGVRVLFPHGWGLVRASNTQPVLVLRFEAATRELLQQYRKEVEQAVGQAQ